MSITHRGGRSRAAAAALAIILAGLAGSACLFRKGKAKAPQYPAAPVRIAVLPLNVARDNVELHWLSLAMVALGTREASLAVDLDLVPAWQALPIAIESLGSSRTLTDELTAYVASRLGARWAVSGEIKSGKGGIELLVDFIPAKNTLVAYRYRKATRVEDLSADLREALTQFLRYLIARPLPGPDRAGLSIDQALLQEIAGALDREHGWFQAAEPGKADRTFSGLERSNGKLARLLFNPALYQAPATRPAAQAR